MDSKRIMIFGGSGSPRLTRRICDHLELEPARNRTRRFSEGNLFVRVLESVRGRDVYLVQSTAFPANDNFMELLFWIDALKRASAQSVTAVVPYFSYAKGDKKDEPRVSIRARVCADAIEAAGADRVVTMDLHAPQIQGFFRIPVDDLYATPILCEAVGKLRLRDLVVVAPDAGFARKARRFAKKLGAELAIGDKQRAGHTESVESMRVIGEVAGRTALIVDDFTLSGGTLVALAEALVDRGARKAYAAITHGVFAPGSMEKIGASGIERLFVTDTVETQPVELTGRIEVVSAAPLFGEAIRRIDNRQSVSVLFED
jgi:ribose-phosphate pyrophosphokinase